MPKTSGSGRTRSGIDPQGSAAGFELIAQWPALNSVEKSIARSWLDLVVEARAGSAAAFSQLVEPYLARALSTARLILAGTPADPEDVVQEALVSAWRGLQGLKDEAAFGAWFRQHVVRTAWKRARRERRNVRLDDRWVDPVDHIEHDLAEHQLGDAFQRLEADDRTVLALRFHLGLSIGETARLLSIPEGTVKSRLHYAVRRLRAAYDAEERR